MNQEVNQEEVQFVVESLDAEQLLELIQAVLASVEAEEEVA
jgi:hypothetical protein